MQQLEMGLRSQTVAAEALFQSQLHKDAKPHFLAMQNGMTRFQLSQAVMNCVSGDRSTASSTETTNHSRSESTGVDNPPPGFPSRFLDGLDAVDQQLVSQHSGHLHGLLNDPVMAGPATDGGFVPLGKRVGDPAGQGA